MAGDSEGRIPNTTFGPIFSRLYSFFASRSGRSLRIYEYIAKDASSGRNQMILDVGCGPGILLAMLADRNPESQVFGVDPSESMVGIARKRLKKDLGVREFKVSVGNSKHIPFDGNFDLIVTSMSFHHWDDRKGSLNYLAGRLETGGVLAVYEHYRNDSEGGSRETAHHSLSRSEAESLHIEGTRKEVRVEGDLISVKFHKE